MKLRKTAAERRSKKRILLSLPCPVVLVSDGLQHDVLLIDISFAGAQLKRAEMDVTLSVSIGDTHFLTIKTPFGTSEAVAKVAWVKTIESSLHWGVKFTAISGQDNDLLRCFIESSDI